MMEFPHKDVASILLHSCHMKHKVDPQRTWTSRARESSGSVAEEFIALSQIPVNVVSPLVRF